MLIQSDIVPPTDFSANGERDEGRCDAWLNEITNYKECLDYDQKFVRTRGGYYVTSSGKCRFYPRGWGGLMGMADSLRGVVHLDPNAKK